MSTGCFLSKNPDMSLGPHDMIVSPHSPEPNDTLRFSPSAKGSPDLPGWLAYDFSRRHRGGVVYGVPPPYLTNFSASRVPRRL